MKIFYLEYFMHVIALCKCFMHLCVTGEFIVVERLYPERVLCTGDEP